VIIEETLRGFVLKVNTKEMRVCETLFSIIQLHSQYAFKESKTRKAQKKKMIRSKGFREFVNANS
jgi:hypothetical protein